MKLVLVLFIIVICKLALVKSIPILCRETDPDQLNNNNDNENSEEEEGAAEELEQPRHLGELSVGVAAAGRNLVEFDNNNEEQVEYEEESSFEVMPRNDDYYYSEGSYIFEPGAKYRTMRGPSFNVPRNGVGNRSRFPGYFGSFL